MRTGAIFARGSCRALKWVALVGMVFALGTVEAAAQGVVPDTDFDTDGVKITVPESVEEGATANILVEVQGTITAGTDGGDVTIVATASVKGSDGATNEVGDVASPETVTITFPDNTDGMTDMEDVRRTGTITLQTRDDDSEAEDEVVAVSFAITGVTGTATDDQGVRTFVIKDDEDQEIQLTEVDAGEAVEGEDVALKLAVKYPPVDDTIDVILEQNGGDDFRLSATSFEFDDTTSDEMEVTLEAVEDNDGNRVADTVRIEVTAGSDGTAPVLHPELDVEIADAHVLPSVTVTVTDAEGEVATQLMEEDGDDETGEGVEYTLTVKTVDKEDATKSMDSAVEAHKVTLSLDPSSVADGSDFTLVPSEVTLPTGTTSDTLTLTVIANVDTGGDDRMERLAFQAVVSGDSDYGPPDPAIRRVVDLDIVDHTTLLVTPKSDADIEAAYMRARTTAAGTDGKWTERDDPLMIPLSELFNLPAQGQAEAMSADETIVEADADADASANGGGMVTVTPMMPGMADVTVTVSTGVSGFTGTQLDATSAQVVFKAMVDGIPVTAKTQAEIDAAYMAARNAAAGADGYWTTEDGPATIALSALFNDLQGATGSVMSSMTDYVLASTTDSAVVLNPEGVGTSTITVTVAGVSASFMATVDAIQLDRRGRITAISIKDADERTIDGKKRMFVEEGDLTELSVTIEWTHQQITALWAGHTTANPPPPARVRVYDTGVWDPDFYEWVSIAETSENPGSGGFGGRDVVLASDAIEVPIPSKPRTDVNSVFETDSGTGSTSLSLPHDVDAEEEGFHIQVSRSASLHYLVNLETSKMRTDRIHVIEDDEVQGVKIERNRESLGTIYEGGADVLFDVTADPRREDLDLAVRYDLTDLDGVSVSDRSYSLARSLGTIPVGNEPDDKHTARINLDPNDGDREDIDLQFHAEVVSYGLDTGAFDDIQSKKVGFKVVDVHKLPWLTVSPVSGAVAEGGEIDLTLTVNRNPANTIATDPEKRQYTSEALTIAVTAGGSASSSDFTMTPSSISVEEYKHTAAKNWMQKVEVTIAATVDEDIDAETLMLDFVVNGTKAENGPRPDGDTESAAQANLTIQDATATLVSVRENAYDVIKGALGDPPMLTTGMSAELMGGNLFDYDSSAVSVTYGTSVEGAAVTASASGGTVTVMGAMAGEAKVTITATATPNASTLEVNQTKANVAQMTFPVMVEDEALVFMVAGPDDMNLVEGGMGGMVTVTTNRAVTANTEVMLMRDGSSTASDDDYTLDPPLVTIMAGQMSGSTMVMATADDMMENEGNMAEMLTLFLVVDGMQMTDKSVSFYLWDAAVPALPIIAQLLLAAFLAVGGYRRYRRR